MKTFLANSGIAYVCFKKYKYKAALYFSLLIPFLAFEVAYNYHKHNNAVFSFLYAILAAVLFGACMFSMYNGIMRMNFIIKKLEIDSSQIIFETFDVSMVFNLVKKGAQIMHINIDQIKFELANVKYGLDLKYTGAIYLLTYANEEYIIPEKFFDNFSELKAALEKSNL